ncbi:hypothetical protein SK128_009074 [Halocaridina rubra]|uniref:Ionotropic glutamate receptor L-glutamate and glycine-binding domain-containing protein n=1 Tax=Halocaridina rubra TaxID=373956 RepID=A0AAN8XUW1_HALRR
MNHCEMKLKESKECSKCTRWGIQAAEVKDAQKFELLRVADWNPTSGLALYDDLFPHVTGFFRGRTIPVASLHIFEKDRSGKIIGYSGLMFAVLDELAAKLNFSYVVRTPPDGQWGIDTGNGNWNGMIRMVQDSEVSGILAFYIVSYGNSYITPASV